MLDVGAVLGQFSALTLVQQSAISKGKAAQPDNYLLHMDAQDSSVCGADARLAVTSSDCQVSLYSRKDLQHINTLSGHEDVLTGVQFTSNNKDLLYSSSLDKTVKCWDLRTDGKKAVQEFKGFAETNNVFTAFDISCDGLFLCAGTEAKKDKDKEMTTHLIFWDTRKAEPLGSYNEAHQDDVTQVCFHSTKRDRLLTGATDGLVNVFDISQEDEDEALLTTLNSDSSVSRLGWTGRNSDHVFCLTHIETFHIWDSDPDQFDPVCEICDVREKFKGDKKIDYMVDCFSLPDSDTPLLLTGSYSGHMNLVSVQGSDMSHVTSISGGHMGVVRCLNWDQQSCTLVTGGEDGTLCLWKTGTDGSTSAPADKHKAKSPGKVKLQKKRKSHPYSH